eukprot:scaffold12335_cov96-Isochrysis_galbana.AAC.3
MTHPDSVSFVGTYLPYPPSSTETTCLRRAGGGRKAHAGEGGGGAGLKGHAGAADGGREALVLKWN